MPVCGRAFLDRLDWRKAGLVEWIVSSALTEREDPRGVSDGGESPVDKIIADDGDGGNGFVDPAKVFFGAVRVGDRGDHFSWSCFC